MLLNRPLAIAGSALLGATVLLSAGCSNTTSESKDGKLTIVTAAYPFEYAAKQVVGDKAEVINLLTPGADAHDLELSPRQVESLAKANLVVYQEKFQAAVDDAIATEKPANVINTATLVTLRENAEGDEHDHDHDADHDHDHDADHDHADHADHDHDADHDHAESPAAEHDHEHESDHDHDHGHDADHDHDGEHHHHDHGKYDPHIWLDPMNVAKIADAIAKKMGELDSANAKFYQDNAAALDTKLGELDKEFATGLAHCKIDTFITNHEAFGYLAAKYGLHQIGISGLSTEEEPSPARIAEVHELAEEHHVTTIFYERAVSPKVAESIANDLGLKTDVLDPVATLSEQSSGKNYTEVMQSNLASLKKANECK